MKYHLEAVYSDGLRNRWPLFASSRLLASQEAQEAAQKLGTVEAVTVYLFDAVGSCIEYYRHEPGTISQGA